MDGPEHYEESDRLLGEYKARSAAFSDILRHAIAESMLIFDDEARDAHVRKANQDVLDGLRMIEPMVRAAQVHAIQAQTAATALALQTPAEAWLAVMES